MRAPGGTVWNIAVSQDGKWIVSGMARGLTVWKARSHSKVGSMDTTAGWL